MYIHTKQNDIKAGVWVVYLDYYSVQFCCRKMGLFVRVTCINFGSCDANDPRFPRAKTMSRSLLPNYINSVAAYHAIYDEQEATLMTQTNHFRLI